MGFMKSLANQFVGALKEQLADVIEDKLDDVIEDALDDIVGKEAADAIGDHLAGALTGQLEAALDAVVPDNGDVVQRKIQGRTWTGYFNDCEARDALHANMQNPVDLDIAGVHVNGTWYGVMEG